MSFFWGKTQIVSQGIKRNKGFHHLVEIKCGIMVQSVVCFSKKNTKVMFYFKKALQLTS